MYIVIQVTKKTIFIFYPFLLGLIPVWLLVSCSDPTSVADIDGPHLPETADTIHYYTYQIVNTYPHDRKAFTQGLLFYDGYLYESTGLYGQSSLRKVDLESGDVLQQTDLSDVYFGEGIALFQNKIYQLTWLSKTGFIFTLNDFNPVGQFSYNTQGWGLLHDGNRFILSDGSSNLYFLDSQTLQIIDTVQVIDDVGPLPNLNELEYINGKVFANVWYTDWIVIIDPETGYISGKIDLSGLLKPEDIFPDTDVLNGIAYDKINQRLFVSGKRWPKLFEIELVETVPVM